AARVGEVDQGDLAQLRRQGVAGQHRGNDAVSAYGKAGAALRHFDGRVQRQALGVDHHAFGIELELAVLGVEDVAVGRFHLEEAATDDGKIHRLAGGLHAAFGEHLLGAGDAHAAAQLDAGRHGIDLIGLGTGLFLDGVEQVFEDRAITLEAIGVHVRQVVGDGRHGGVLGGQTGLADPKCGTHALSPDQLPRIIWLPALERSSAAFIIFTWVSNRRLRLMVLTSSSMAETLLDSRKPLTRRTSSLGTAGSPLRVTSRPASFFIRSAAATSTRRIRSTSAISQSPGAMIETVPSLPISTRSCSGSS